MIRSVVKGMDKDEVSALLQALDSLHNFLQEYK